MVKEYSSAYSESTKGEQILVLNSKGLISDALYDAVFALEKPGDISGLIPTDSGYYIVKYVSDAKVTDSDLSDYRKTVKKELLTSRQSEKTNAILEEWRNAVNYEYDYEKLNITKEEETSCQLTALSHALGGSPLDVDADELVDYFASRSWKPETRKSARNAVVSFFRWLQASGKRDDDPSDELPSVRRPQAHPRPCPDRVIIQAMQRADDEERLMLRLGAECVTDYEYRDVNSLSGGQQQRVVLHAQGPDRRHRHGRSDKK